MFEDFKVAVFMQVAKDGSFTKAAAALGVTQPAVSQNIAELERQCGVKLFTREKGTVSLTAQGLVLMEFAEKINSLGQSAGSLFIKLPPSSVRIFASDEIWQFLLLPRLTDFQKIHPEIQFRRTTDRNADIVLALVPSTSFSSVENAVAKLRVGMSAVQSPGTDLSASIERVLVFDLVYIPSPAFSGNPLCSVVRSLLPDASFCR